MNRSLRFTFALLLAAAAAHAQTGTGVATPGTMADSLYTQKPAVTDSLAPATIPTTTPAAAPAGGAPVPTRPHVLAVRAESVIRVERDQMQLLGDAAETDLMAAKRSRAEVNGTIDILKKDIDAQSARVKAAKQAKNDATRDAAETERKRLESVRSYFEHLRDVHDAAVDEATARGDYARAGVRTCDWELQLVGRSGVAANDGDPSLFKVEQQYFDSVKARAVAESHFAEQAQTLADRKLRLYRAWADWLGGR